MKNFIKFLIFSLILIAGFIIYNMKYPSDGMIVRDGGKWVVIEHNSTK